MPALQGDYSALLVARAPSDLSFPPTDPWRISASVPIPFASAPFGPELPFTPHWGGPATSVLLSQQFIAQAGDVVGFEFQRFSAAAFSPGFVEDEMFVALGGASAFVAECTGGFMPSCSPLVVPWLQPPLGRVPTRTFDTFGTGVPPASTGFFGM